MICNPSHCTGCAACGDVCPREAIHMVLGENGHYIPKINSEKCIDCKLCTNICSAEKKLSEVNLETTRVYGGWAEDYSLRKHSSSGGIFTMLAKVILHQNGVVVGAAFDNLWNVKHRVIDSLDDLELLRRSKYVQSDCSGIYRKVLKYLAEGRKVLFSGTPCQIGAMRQLAPNDSKNLFLCEVFCYGVPSPVIFHKWLSFLETKEKSRICAINFKDKRYGWDYYTTEICFENGLKLCEFGGDTYKKLMQQGYSLRESCFHCHYDVQHSYADFSLGDFYTYHQYLEVHPPKNGISCVITRSNKADKIIHEIDDIQLYPINGERFFANEKSPLKLFPQEYVRFQQLMNEIGYADTLKTFGISRKKSIRMLLQALRMRYFRW